MSSKVADTVSTGSDTVSYSDPISRTDLNNFSTSRRTTGDTDPVSASDQLAVRKIALKACIYRYLNFIPGRCGLDSVK
jgi:hypothetical protein